MTGSRRRRAIWLGRAVGLRLSTCGEGLAADLRTPGLDYGLEPPRRELADRQATARPNQAITSERAYLGVLGVSQVARGPCPQDRHLLSVDGSTRSSAATSVVVIRTGSAAVPPPAASPRTGARSLLLSLMPPPFIGEVSADAIAEQ